MKSFLASLLALTLILIPIKTHAAPPYPLSVEKLDSGIGILMTGVPNDESKYQLYDGNTLITQPGAPTTPWIQQRASDGTVFWGLDPSEKVFRFHVKRLPKPFDPSPIHVEVTNVVVFPADKASTLESIVKDFQVVPSGSGKVTVSGKIDTSVYENVKNLRIDFYYSKTGDTTTGPTNAGPLTAGVGGQADIAPDGTYAIIVSNLTPGQIYYFKQTISVNGSSTPFETKIDKFTADKGYLIPGSVGEQLDFNSRSYHLLAPLPGLSVLMDPDLCAEKKAKGEVPANAICDVNGFLDFAFKLLIGLAAVILVIRLMIEGYKILTTDVPFIAASAKGNFFSALLGLLLALSAYLILNTINPKLVNNKITIDSVNVGVEEFKFSDVNQAYTVRNGVRVKINSIKMKEVLPYAEKAETASGVKKENILAILAIETNLGTKQGACYWDDTGVMPPEPGRNADRDDKTIYKGIISDLKIGLRDHKVSCALSNSTWGGGMGPSQHIPTYWKQFAPKITAITGRPADPWDLQDAVYALAFHMAADGAVNDPENAACKYYSGHACGTRSRDFGKYGNLDYRDKFRNAVVSVKAELTKIK
jgi:hypothetical protein